MQLDGLEGRVAFVTGGARGIGRCITETLRDQGAKVASGDLQPPSIEGVLAVEVDVADESLVDAAFTQIEAELGNVEILVSNAGILISEPFETTSLESWRHLMGINLTGAFLCARRGCRTCWRQSPGASSSSHRAPAGREAVSPLPRIRPRRPAS